MITPSGYTVEQYCNAIKNGCCHARMTFPIEDIVLTDEDFESNGIEIMDCMNPEEDLTFGTATSRELTAFIVRSNKTDSLKWTNEFQLEFGADINGSTVWVTAGYFTGKRPTKTNTDIIQFVAYDRMTKFDVIADDFLTSLDYTGGLTLGDIYDALCAYVGVTNVSGDEISAHMAIEYTASPFSATGMTCRQILQWIAEAAGCYAKILNDGTLKMVWFSHHESEFSLKRDDCYAIDISEIHWEQDPSKIKKWADLEADKWEDLEGFTWQELEGYYSPTKINAVKLVNTLGNTGIVEPDTAQEVNIYTIIDNPFLYYGDTADISGYVSNLFNRLKDFGSYIPATTECEGNWLVEPGDIIEFEFAKDDTGQLPLFNTTIHWNGGCRCIYETTGNVEREPVSSGNKVKYEVGGKFHEIRKDVDELYSEINNPTTGLATRLEQTEEGLELVAEKKARIYYSNTAPTGTQDDPLMEGDLWIDTANGNQLNRYNGSSWTDASFDDPGKYTVQSGIDINANGVDITGDQYIKLTTGNNNVELSKQKIELDAENVKFIVNPSGLEYVYEIPSQYIRRTSRIDRYGGLFNRVRIGSDSINIDDIGLTMLTDEEGGLTLYRYERANNPSGMGQVYFIDYIIFGTKNNTNDSEMYFYPKSSSTSGWYVASYLGKSDRKWDYAYFGGAYANSYNNYSSREVKHDIKALPPVGEKLDKLEPVTFIYNDDKEEKTRNGLIYEDTVDILPDICNDNGKAKTIDYVALVPILLKEIQDLRKRVADLESRL